MPCYDSRSEPSYVRAEAKREFQADLNKLTRLLCEVMTVIDEADMELNVNPSDELYEWWKEHKKLDKAREG